MESGRTELLLVPDHNLGNLVPVLRGVLGDHYSILQAPLDQVVQVLHQEHPPAREALVWTLPQRISATFQDARNYKSFDPAAALDEVDRFADAIRVAATTLRAVHIPLWSIDPSERYGRSELHGQRGLHALLMRMNLRLMDRLSDLGHVHLMHTDRWIQQAGPQAWSQRLWHMAKIPFSNEVYLAMAKDLSDHVHVSSGRAIKLIVLDLDDTLWGGIVGDDGWQNLRLGGHDALGESFVAFQRTLLALKERGCLLAIASKNDHAVAMEAITSHPEMVLRPSDFVATRINWQDKAANIADMVRELNLGHHSVLFLDDNPVERARVREMLPEVVVPEWPSNKLLYDQFLRALPGLDPGTASAEDVRRTQLYVDERAREDSRSTSTDLLTWLRSLDMKVEASPVNDADHARVLQLFGKTNQFNLTTRRLSDAELKAIRQHPDHRMWSFRVSDRFGDAGLTGVLGMDLQDPDVALISDLILSCRVMGRQVEETMLHVAYRLAKEAGRKRMEARFIPTAKNRPILEFLQASVLTNAEEGRFVHALTEEIACPPSLELMIHPADR